jgi:hypothetical protein
MKVSTLHDDNMGTGKSKHKKEKLKPEDIDRGLWNINS